MNTRTLTADVEIPYLGFGTYLIADDAVAAAVGEAIRAGYRHIDTAEGYQLVRYLDDNSITPIAYSSLVPLSTWRTTAGQDSAKTEQMKADGEQADAPFKVMAKKYGVSEAQVLLRWAVQKGYPVLPKSTNPERIRANADIFGFSIDDEDMGAIEKMDRGDGVAWAMGDPTKAP